MSWIVSMYKLCIFYFLCSILSQWVICEWTLFSGFFIRSQYVEIVLKRGYILILKCFGEKFESYCCCLSSVTTFVFGNQTINKTRSLQKLTLVIKLRFCVVWSKPSKALAAIEIMFTPNWSRVTSTKIYVSFQAFPSLVLSSNRANKHHHNTAIENSLISSEAV